MKEKDLIKQATDLDIPDFEKVKCNIVISKEDNLKSFRVKKLVSIFACCCLIIVAALAIPNLLDQQGNRLPLNNHPNVPRINNRIIFNALHEASAGKMKLNFDPEKTYKKELTVDEVISYLGTDVRPTKLPYGLKDYTKVYPDYKFTAIYNNDDTVAYEEFTFSYKVDFQSTEYNPLEKQFQVCVSKQEFIRDYVIVFDDEMDKSIINGQELLLGKRKMSYGPYTVVKNGPNIPAGYYDIFVAKFIVKGVHFEVVSDNFTEDEFVETLASIIK
jgi:hypothetical protein